MGGLGFIIMRKELPDLFLKMERTKFNGPINREELMRAITFIREQFRV